MLLLALMWVSQAVKAQDDVTDSYRNGGFDEVVMETAAPEVSLRPPDRPAPVPPVKVEPSVQKEPQVLYRRGVEFTKTNQYDRNTEFFKKFQQVFLKCSGGCDAGRAHVHRHPGYHSDQNGNRVRNRITSCHHRNEAIDVHALVCNGVEYSAYTNRFKKFVDCVKGESYQGKKWKTLFRDSRKSCQGANINHTSCHYNHAHFSLGCWVQRSNGTWKAYW